MKRNHYRVILPGDCADSLDTLAEMAINEARERARIYCIPATWIAHHVKGDIGDWQVVFNVYRYHR